MITCHAPWQSPQSFQAPSPHSSTVDEFNDGKISKIINMEGNRKWPKLATFELSGFNCNLDFVKC